MADKKNTKLEIAIVVDESGSMYSLKDDVIGGINSLLDENRKEEDTIVTMTVFSNDVRFVQYRKPITEIPSLTNNSYQPSGCTSLLDAIGTTVDRIRGDRGEDDSKMMLVIMTDGYENNSKEYTYEMIQKRMKDLEGKWEIIFLAANLDSAEAAKSFGIREDRARNWSATSDGMKRGIGAVACAAKMMRCSATPVMDNASFDCAMASLDEDN